VRHEREFREQRRIDDIRFRVDGLQRKTAADSGWSRGVDEPDLRTGKSDPRGEIKQKAGGSGKSAGRRGG